MKTDLLNTVHIYAQPWWHGEAVIVGTPEGLTRLRDALDKAIREGHGKASLMVNDGEGYDAHALRYEDDQGWLPVPYEDEGACAGNRHEDFQRLWTLVREADR